MATLEIPVGPVTSELPVHLTHFIGREGERAELTGNARRSSPRFAQLRALDFNARYAEGMAWTTAERAPALRVYGRYVDRLREEPDPDPPEEAVELAKELRLGRRDE